MATNDKQVTSQGLPKLSSSFTMGDLPMQFRTTYRFFSLLLVLAILLLALSCKKDDSPKTVPIPALSDTTQDKKTTPVKITATKKDLCRIIMKQKRLLNENDKMDDRTTTVITTLLSDGSGERVVANVDSIVKSLKSKYYDSVCNFQTNVMISRNLDYLIFFTDYCDSKSRLLTDNFVKYDLQTKKSELLISGTDYEYSIYDAPPQKPIEQHVSEYAFFTKANTLFIKKAYSLWTINCKNGQKTKYQEGLTLSRILPVSGSECYANFHSPTDPPYCKQHVGKFNIGTQRIEPLPAVFDSFFLTPADISENANTILIFRKTRFTGEENYHPFDTVYVFNQAFQRLKHFIVDKKEGAFYVNTDPNGKWLFFDNDNIIYRIRLSDITDGGTYTVKDFIAKSQCVYQAPTKNEIPYEIQGFFLTSVTE
jgi:hypothetical protein